MRRFSYLYSRLEATDKEMMVPANQGSPPPFSQAEALALLFGAGGIVGGGVAVRGVDLHHGELWGPWVVLAAGLALMAVASRRVGVGRVLALLALGASVAAVAALVSTADRTQGGLTLGHAVSVWGSLLLSLGLVTLSVLPLSAAFPAAVAGGLVMGLAGSRLLSKLGGWTSAGGGLEFGLALVSAGAGLVALAWHYSRDDEGEGIPAFLPWVAFTMLLTVAVGVWQEVARDERVRRRHAIEVHASDLRDELAVRLDSVLSPLNLLASRWETSGRPERARWDEDTSVLIRHGRVFERIEWLDAAMTLRWAAQRPELPPAEDELGVPRLTKGRRNEIAHARERRELQLVRWGDKSRYELFAPLSIGRDFDGFLVGRFDTADLFDAAVDADLTPELCFEITDGGKPLFARKDKSCPNVGSLSVDLPLYGSVWRIEAWPSPAMGGRASLAWSVFLVGGLIAFVVALLLQLVRVTARRAAERGQVALALAESESRLIKQAAALDEARRSAEEELRNQNEFLSGMRNELRSVVEQLSAPARQLAGVKLAPRQREAARAVTSWVEPLKLLLEDLTDFQSSERGQLRLASTEFSPARLIEEVSALFGGAAHAKSVRIQLNLSPLPAVLRGDPSRLRRVLVHAFDAALASPACSQVSLRVAALNHSSVDVGLRFECGVIASQGAVAASVFDVVLGSLAKRFVRLMDGEIGVSGQATGKPTLWFIAYFRTVDVPAGRAEAEGLRPDEKPLSRPKLMREVSPLVSRLRRRAKEEDWGHFSTEASGLELLCRSARQTRVAQRVREMAELTGKDRTARVLEQLDRIESELKPKRSTEKRRRAG